MSTVMTEPPRPHSGVLKPEQALEPPGGLAKAVTSPAPEGPNQPVRFTRSWCPGPTVITTGVEGEQALK